MQDQKSRKAAVDMEDEAEYKRQLELFVRSSTEKGIELVKVGEVIASLARRRSFLDIGAGGGDLTIPISRSFRDTFVVEPNEKQAAFLKRRCPEFTVYNSLWDEVDLGSRRFDLILCSHVLYYIEPGHWLSTIKKMYEHLNEGGSIAVVLQSPLGEVADFFNHFTTYDVDILGLWRDLIYQYREENVSVRYFINEIWTYNIDDMVTIGLFLLLDAEFKSKRDKIRRYLETRHRVEGGYRIKQDEILLAVKKPAGG